MAAIGAQLGRKGGQQENSTLGRSQGPPSNATRGGPNMFDTLRGAGNFAKSARGCGVKNRSPLPSATAPLPRGGTSFKRDVQAAIGAQGARDAHQDSKPCKRAKTTQVCQRARSVKSGAAPAPRKSVDKVLAKIPAIGGPTVTQWLEELRKEKLRSATWKQGQLFVDLFSGPRSPVGRQVGKRGGAYIAFDILIDERFDVTNPEVEQLLKRWIQQGLVWGVWLGTDCTTWSRASYCKGLGWFNFYRSRQNLWGELAKLSPKAKQRVLEGNQHALFSCRMLWHVLNQPLAVAGLENPAGSVIWLLPQLLALERDHPSKVHKSICDYCQYGAPWKKPTTFLWVGIATALAPCKRCGTQKGHICPPRTGKEHLRLGQGRCHPTSGKKLTKLATPYPPKLAAQLVDCLAKGK